MKLARVVAIARADALIRLRRPSTIVVFLLLSACAYFWIPDPASGRALIQISGRRALYNSAAIGMATAALGTVFVGLIGFYVISNAVRRDIDTRCGLLLASTPMRGSEYVFGKFAGNLAFLVVFMSGFMMSSMAMLVLRGEARLEPLVFIRQYAFLVTPTLFFVSAIAIVFECTPGLSGRFGDVLYFFLWAGSMGLVAAILVEGGGSPSPVIASFDFSGFGYLIDEVRMKLGAKSMSIGASSFDPSKPPIIFDGLTLGRRWLIPRLVTTVMPITFLGVALLFFHRFDPARIRGPRGHKARRFARINQLLKPIARLPFALPGGPVVSDATLTFTAAPWAVVIWIGISIAALANPESLPIAFAATAIVISDIACRDVRAGTVPLIRAAPGLRERFVWWKFASTSLVAFAMMTLPLVRARAPIAAIVGVVFIAAMATAIGIAAENPKAFIVLFLTFWYVVVNDRGSTPALNLGGMFGTPRADVTLIYALIAIVAVVLAATFYAWRLRRGA